MTAHDLVQLSERVAQERAAARAIIDSLGEDAWSTPIPPAWQTAGFIEELLAASLEEMEHDPQRSLHLAQLGVTAATGIKEGVYPDVLRRQLEGSAWLQVARSHRNMSQFEPALRALDRAERRFSASAALGHDQAIALMQRAIIFNEMGRYDDSMRILDEVEPLLEEYGDTRRMNHAAMVRAMIYTRTMQLERAAAVYETLVIRMQDDRRNLVSLYGNLASLRLRMDDFDGGVAAYQQSRALAVDLDMPTEVVRADWKLAKAVMTKGDWARATELLQRVRTAFLALSLPGEAGLVALDIVECLVATNQLDAAIDLTTKVIDEFIQANLNNRAMTALAYLRDLLPDANRARDAVQHVRSYVERLRQQPELAFLPLP